MSVISFQLLCRWCGQDLQGQAFDNNCPNCRHEVADTLETRVIDVARMEVNRDVPCVHCTYNLRTLPIAGLCPECGKPVVDSLQRNNLYFADLKWLRMAHDGLICLLVWLAGFSLYLIGASISPVIVFLLSIFLWPLWCIWFVGIMNLMTPNEYEKVREKHVHWWAGMAAICGMSVFFSPLFAYILHKYWFFFLSVGWAAHIIVSLLVLFRLRQLIRKEKHKFLIRLTMTQIIVSTITWCLGGVTMVWTLFPTPSPMWYDPFNNLLDAFFRLQIVILLPSYILAFIIFYRFKVLFAQAIHQAENH